MVVIDGEEFVVSLEVVEQPTGALVQKSHFSHDSKVPHVVSLAEEVVYLHDSSYVSASTIQLKN